MLKMSVDVAATFFFNIDSDIMGRYCNNVSFNIVYNIAARYLHNLIFLHCSDIASKRLKRILNQCCLNVDWSISPGNYFLQYFVNVVSMLPSQYPLAIIPCNISPYPVAGWVMIGQNYTRTYHKYTILRY